MVSQHCFDVATLFRESGVATWVDPLGGCDQKLVSRYIFVVATWLKGRWVMTRN